MQAKRLSDRNFGLMFAIVFCVIAAVVWLINGSYQYWAVEIALAFLCVALVWPTALMPLNRLWEQLGYRLGLVSNFLLLSTFFYLVITPFGVVMRLLSTDPMLRRPDRRAKSYFMPVRRHADATTFSDMF
jgi:Saxitoxin biosynthesis operon protein SxtJ